MGRIWLGRTNRSSNGCRTCSRCWCYRDHTTSARSIMRRINMKKFASALPALAVLLLAATVCAGVVVDEQQAIDQPGGNSVVRTRTVMIEGDKQKSIIGNGERSVITDLGKGTMTMVDTTHKAYVEFPFPLNRKGASAMPGTKSSTISFKK